MCTPSLLERRKSMPVNDDVDDEVIIKLPTAEGDEGSDSEEPSEEEAE